MRIRTLSLAALVSLSISGLASAQDPLIEIYGKAVHAYFRGDRFGASELLNNAISSGLQDPRAFYYRGLCNMNMGGIDTAIADFEQGAALEMSGKTSVDVGRSLERIQGQARSEIEKARSRARVAARATILEQQRTKLDAMMRPTDGGLAVPSKPAPGLTAPGIAPLAPNDPFNAAPARQPVPQSEPVMPAADPNANPFPTTPATPADDVFGGANNPAPAKPAEPDPFGT